MMKNLLNVYYDEKTSIDNINPVPFHLLTKLILSDPMMEDDNITSVITSKIKTAGYLLIKTNCGIFINKKNHYERSYTNFKGDYKGRIE